MDQRIGDVVIDSNDHAFAAWEDEAPTEPDFFGKGYVSAETLPSRDLSTRLARVIALEDDIMNQNVITALEEQVGCYRRLARLAEVQHEHVQQSQIEALLLVLQSRQQVLDQLKELEAVIAPAKQRWSEFADEIGEQRPRAEELLAETRRLLEQITSSDRDDAMVLQQRKLNLGKQINQATAAKQVNRNYAAAAYGKRNSSMDLSR